MNKAGVEQVRGAEVFSSKNTFDMSENPFNCRREKKMAGCQMGYTVQLRSMVDGDGSLSFWRLVEGLYNNQVALKKHKTISKRKRIAKIWFCASFFGQLHLIRWTKVLLLAEGALVSRARLPGTK
jgi:hypothetical protein